MRTTILLLACALSASCDVSFREHCTYDSKMEHRAGKEFDKSTWFAKDKIRVDETEEGTTTIFRFDRGVMWMLSPNQPNYFESPIKAVKATASAESASRKKRLEELKADLQKQLEAAMKALADAKTPDAKKAAQDNVDDLKRRLDNIEQALRLSQHVAVVFPGTDKLTILGHPTLMHKVYVDGVPLLEVWVSTEEPKIPNEFSRGVKDYRDFVKDMYTKYDADTEERAIALALLESTKGMPLRERRMLASGLKAGKSGRSALAEWLISEVTELYFKPVPSATFDLPPGAKK